jgi:Zn finger protein HypA/HybF involved in hydrogenase expression
MSRQALEVADIFRAQGEAWRQAHAGHISLGQLKVMSAIEACRSAALGGHVLRCSSCEHQQVAYNSCRNRHCPKCQGSAAHRWLEARQADLLPVEYYHLVFTLPAQIRALAYSNQSVIYAILFKAVAETLRTIAADPKHLGARIGLTLVLHTWGSAMIHHPHVHGIVPGGGLSLDGKRWIHCRPGFFLPVPVLSCLFRRLFLQRLSHAYQAGELKFFGECRSLADTNAFLNWIKPLRKINWVAYAKPPFAGPEEVLAYLSRYTHRVAIANSRLLAFNDQGVTFKWKDYRAKPQFRHKIMTLKTDEFIRRFLIHVLPSGFHRIRHYGLLANSGRRDNLKRARELLIDKTDDDDANADGAIENTKAQQNEVSEQVQATYICPDCGSPMVIIERFERGQLPRAPPLGIIAL